MQIDGKTFESEPWLCDTCTEELAVFRGLLSKAESEKLRTELAPVKEENRKLAEQVASLEACDKKTAELFEKVLS